MRIDNAEICRWKYDAVTPVCLMVDDLTNVWIKNRKGRAPRPGDDWGHFGRARNGCLWWLENKILNNYPQARVTFFVPIHRVPRTVDHSCPSYFGSIVEEDVLPFFRSVHHDPRYELAYHGLTHGISGNGDHPFVQEWAGFQSLEQAIEQTNRGRELFRQVTGEYPRGGKYCGYERNEFSDESIDCCGFDWWCRLNNRGAVKEGEERPEHFMVKAFGRKPVIDLPTTLYGHVLSSPPYKANAARWALFWGRKYLIRPGELRRQLAFLLEHKLPILIQEHSARSTDVGLPQTPNIVDDTYGLRRIYAALHDVRVWHATCSEIAAYDALRERLRVNIVDGGRRFQLNHVPEEACGDISLLLRTRERGGLFQLKASDGAKHKVRIENGHGVLTINPENGEYRVDERRTHD